MTAERKKGRPSGRPSRKEPTNTTVTAGSATWMYSMEGARLFEAGEIVPDGFVDTPAKVMPDGAE